MDFETKVDLNSLWAAGLSAEKVNGLDMVLLPENAQAKIEDRYDAQDSITLSKLLKTPGRQVRQFL